MELLHDLIFDYNLRNVALGSALLGIVSGVLGCFAVLRKQGLLGDALAHAALPGICIAYLLTGSKSTIVLLLGAAIAGWVATYFLLRIVRGTIILGAHNTLPTTTTLDIHFTSTNNSEHAGVNMNGFNQTIGSLASNNVSASIQLGSYTLTAGGTTPPPPSPG